MNNSTILSWMTFLPLIGASLILPVLLARAAGAITKEMGDQISRLIGLVASGIVLLLGIKLWLMYDAANPLTAPSTTYLSMAPSMYATLRPSQPMKFTSASMMF